MWIPKGAALIRRRCLFETWHLLEEIRYRVHVVYLIENEGID